MRRAMPPSIGGTQISPPPQQHTSTFNEACHSGAENLHPLSSTPNLPPHPSTTPGPSHEKSCLPQSLWYVVSPTPKSHALTYEEGTSLEAAHDPHLRQSNMLYIKNMKYF